MKTLKKLLVAAFGIILMTQHVEAMQQDHQVAQTETTQAFLRAVDDEDLNLVQSTLDNAQDNLTNLLTTKEKIMNCTALHLAVRAQHAAIIKSLLNAVKINHPLLRQMLAAQDVNGNTVLHYAILLNNKEIVQTLKFSATICNCVQEFLSTKDGSDKTAYDIAVRYGHQDIAALLQN